MSAHSPALTPSQTADARQQERVTVFLLPAEEEHIPVWISVPSSLPSGTAALVTNLNERGIQVFTPPGIERGPESLRLHRLDDEDGPEAVHQFSTRVQQLWRRTVSHSGDQHRLVFLDAADAMEKYLRAHGPEPRSRNWVRCAIAPMAECCPTANA